MMGMKLSERQWMVAHAAASFVAVLLVSNVVAAQEGGEGALVFLDKIGEFFRGLVNHWVWPTMLGVFFTGFIVLYAKTRDLRMLFGALGCAAGGGLWATRAAVWLQLTGTKL